MNEPFERDLHDAFQRLRRRQAAQAPDFEATLRAARSSDAGSSSSTEFQPHRIRPAAAVCLAAAAIAVTCTLLCREPAAKTPVSLVTLIDEIAVDNRHNSEAPFGSWSAPSDQLSRPFSDLP